MLDDVSAEVIANFVIRSIAVIGKRVNPYASRALSAVWRQVCAGVKDDCRKIADTSRTHKLGFAVFIIYCIPALATGVIMGDSAPMGVQVWVSILPVLMVGGYVWLGIRKMRQVAGR